VIAAQRVTPTLNERLKKGVNLSATNLELVPVLL
jgi:hypothetical protein